MKTTRRNGIVYQAVQRQPVRKIQRLRKQRVNLDDLLKFVSQFPRVNKV